MTVGVRSDVADLEVEPSWKMRDVVEVESVDYA